MSAALVLATVDPFEAAWVYVDSPVECSVCGEVCRSFDPEGLPRHPMCKPEGSSAVGRR